jgi:hypothetical protein
MRIPLHYKLLLVNSFLQLVYSNSSYSQTYIEPLAGYRFSNIVGLESEDYPYYNHVHEPSNFSNINFLLGLSLTQNLSKNLSLSVQGHFTNVNVRFRDFGIVGWTDLKYKSYSISVQPKYQLTKNIGIGAGINYSMLRNFYIGKKWDDIWHEKSKDRNQNQLGGIISVNYIINPFLFELRYLHSKSLNYKEGEFISKASSIEFSIAYSFKILN